MGKIIPVSIIAFYFLALFQASFMPHFGIYGVIPNIVLLAIFTVNFFEKQEGKVGFLVAIFGGFFMDIFSGRFLGFYVLISLGICFFVKYILRSYIRLPAIN
jgi:rod shape-determining protein MreD